LPNFHTEFGTFKTASIRLCSYDLRCPNIVLLCPVIHPKTNYNYARARVRRKRVSGFVQLLYPRFRPTVAGAIADRHRSVRTGSCVVVYLHGLDYSPVVNYRRGPVQSKPLIKDRRNVSYLWGRQTPPVPCPYLFLRRRRSCRLIICYRFFSRRTGWVNPLPVG